MDIPGFSLDLSSLGGDKTPSPEELYDMLIVGGGPAAMTAVVYAARKMLKLAMVTKDFGGQVTETSEIENYMGFQTITGEELARKFQEQALAFDVPVQKEDRVVKVEKTGEQVFLVHTERGLTLRARTVVLATGKRSRPLNVPGEKEFVGKGVTYCATCDAPFYKGKKVVVAGGANSAFTAALDLLKVDAEVTMVNFVEGWQADQVLIDMVKDNPKLSLLDFHAVARIEGDDRVRRVVIQNRATGEEKVVEADGVFVEIGLIPNSESVEGLVEMNEAREIVVDCHCRTSVPGLFAAGDVTTVPYKQIIISAGEGAKAALAAYDYLANRGEL